MKDLSGKVNYNQIKSELFIKKMRQGNPYRTLETEPT
jgi:hypothetical protein